MSSPPCLMDQKSTLSDYLRAETGLAGVVERSVVSASRRVDPRPDSDPKERDGVGVRSATDVVQRRSDSCRQLEVFRYEYPGQLREVPGSDYRRAHTRAIARPGQGHCQW